MVEKNRQPARSRLLALGLAAAAGLSAQTFAAQSDMGRPDPSFNSSGKTSTNLGGLDNAQAVAVQGDGRIVLAGSTVDSGYNSQWALARYLPNGRLDPTFGEDGVIRTDFEGDSSDNPQNEAAYEIALHGQDILVAGAALGASGDDGDFALARYSKKAQGGWGMDEEFGEGGKVTADLGNSFIGDRALAIAVKANRQIVVGGWGGPADSDPAEFNPCLALFEEGGKFLKGGCPDVGYQAGADAIAVQDDRVVVAGAAHEEGGKLFLARYSLDGGSGPTLDRGFGEAQTPALRKGYAKSNLGKRAFAVAVRDGKITIAGLAAGQDKDLVIQRYDASGVLDGTFGSDAAGTLTVDLPGFEPSAETPGMGMHVEPDGKIIVSSGQCADACPEGGAPIVRINADGKGLDQGFGQGGVTSAGFSEKAALVDLAPDPKGKIVAAGWIDIQPEAPLVGDPPPPQDDFAVARFVLEPRALVAGLEPKQGPVTGGGRITIRGSRLAGATSVLFGQSRLTAHPCPATGSTPCFSVISESEIVAQGPPASTTGPVHVVVDTPEGRSLETNNSLYNYLPVIAEVVPRQGPKAGRTLVKVTGAGLENTKKVMFGGKAVDTSCLLPNVLLSTPCFTVQSPHQVNVFSPPSQTAGKVHVRVDVGTGVSEETEADIFSYLDEGLLQAPAPPPTPGKGGAGGQNDVSGPPVSGTSAQPGGARPPISGLGGPPGGPFGPAPGLTGPATTSPHLGPASALAQLPGPPELAAAAGQGILQAPVSVGPVVSMPAFQDDPAVHPAPRYGMSGMPALAISTLLLACCFAIAVAGRFPASRPVRASAAPAR